MPWIKICVTVYKDRLAETTFREDFICGEGDGKEIEKGLVREVFVELVRVFKRYNRCNRNT